MFKILINIFITLLATIIQIVCLPINALLTSVVPDLSSTIISTTNTITGAFSGMAWAIGLVPVPVINTLIFILTIEIAKHSATFTAHVIAKVWATIQRIKFW